MESHTYVSMDRRLVKSVTIYRAGKGKYKATAIFRYIKLYFTYYDREKLNISLSTNLSDIEVKLKEWGFNKVYNIFQHIDNAELSTSYISDEFAVKEAHIAVIDGEYRINNGEWLSHSKYGVTGTIEVRNLATSSDYSTVKTVLLIINGVRYPFMIKTKSKPRG